MNQSVESPKFAISVEVHPNPDSYYEDIVTQAYDYMQKVGIPVWFMIGPLRLVMIPNTKSLFDYLKAAAGGLQELERREMAKQKPKLVISNQEPANQAIITSIPPNGPFSA